MQIGNNRQKNKGFTPTPILKKISAFLANLNVLSFFAYQTRGPVGIGVSLRSKRGFTLVELLVTISMFVIVTGVVLVNSNRFSSTILLNNFAYDVALTIKQAQTFGVNVRESISGTFNYPYGVYFNTDTPIGRTSFTLFNDISGINGTGNSNNIYDGSLSSCPTNSLECIQRYTMTRGTYIKSICVGPDDINCQLVNQLSVLFKRPDPTALIYAGNPLFGPQSYAKIILSAADGATSTVVVTSVGQIYVKK